MTISLSRKLLMPALLAIAIAPLTLTATADHHGGGHHERAEHHADQHEESRQALYERAGIDEATREALRQASDEHHEALKELHEQHREHMDELLDEEQREALEEARKERRDERREERRAAMQARLEELVESWGLSEEERDALRGTRERIYMDLEELRARDFDSREARHEAMREMREEHHGALTEILSDEQLEELRDAMKPRGGKDWGRHHGHHPKGKGADND